MTYFRRSNLADHPRRRVTIRTMERGDAVSLKIGTRTITYQIKGDEGGLSPTTPAAVMAEVKKVAESSGLFVGAAGLSIDPEDPSRLLIEPLTSNLGRVEFQSIERTNINDQAAVVGLTEEPRPALPSGLSFLSHYKRYRRFSGAGSRI